MIFSFASFRFEMVALRRWTWTWSRSAAAKPPPASTRTRRGPTSTSTRTAKSPEPVRSKRFFTVFFQLFTVRVDEKFCRPDFAMISVYFVVFFFLETLPTVAAVAPGNQLARRDNQVDMAMAVDSGIHRCRFISETIRRFFCCCCCCGCCC